MLFVWYFLKNSVVYIRNKNVHSVLFIIWELNFDCFDKYYVKYCSLTIITDLMIL